jgi:hypothetical protein
MPIWVSLRKVRLQHGARDHHMPLCFPEAVRRSDGVWTHSSARSGTGRSAFMASSSHQMAGGGDARQSIPCF